MTSLIRWVEGGTAEALADALDVIQHARRTAAGTVGAVPGTSSGARAPSRAPSRRRSHTGCDEAIRDAALMMAFIRSSAQGRTLAPSALYGGVIALPRSQIWDASGTFTFTAAARVPCMTEAEVQLLLKASSVPGAVPGAELLLNTSSVPGAVPGAELLLKTSSVPGAVPGAVLRPSVIRPLGCGHSWSGYSAVPGAVLLDMTRMDRVLDTTLAVDVVGGPVARHASAHHGAGAGPSVLVQPGLTLRDLRTVLAAHGCTLPSSP